jgi:hypothetical protein
LGAKKVKIKREPNTFKVQPTDVHTGAKDDYIVLVSPKTKKKLKRFAVAIHKLESINREFRVPCRVLVDQNLSDDTIKIDQTLRTALAIPYEYDEKKEKIQLYSLSQQDNKTGTPPIV